MTKMFEAEDARARRRMILAVIALATLPCYCMGAIALTFAPGPASATPTSTSTAGPDGHVHAHLNCQSNPHGDCVDNSKPDIQPHRFSRPRSCRPLHIHRNPQVQRKHRRPASRLPKRRRSRPVRPARHQRPIREASAYPGRQRHTGSQDRYDPPQASMTDILPFLKSLISVAGLSGYEEPVVKLIRKEWTPLVDEISTSRHRIAACAEARPRASAIARPS